MKCILARMRIVSAGVLIACFAIVGAVTAVQWASREIWPLGPGRWLSTGPPNDDRGDLAAVYSSPNAEQSPERPNSRAVRAARRPLEFQAGMSKADVEHLLALRKLEHHYDEREHKIYAILGSLARTGTSSASLQDEIVLGRDGKVATVRETIVYTGGWGFAGSREIQ
jgi:hypothetical protein